MDFGLARPPDPDPRRETARAQGGIVNLLRRLLGLIPTLLLAFALAAAVWISAVTSSDPVEERVFPRTLAVELIGQDPAQILTLSDDSQVTLRMSAPRSIWDRMINDRVPIRALADLSGLGPGTYDVPVQVQVNITPKKIISYSPTSIKISIESLKSMTFPIKINRKGEPAVGYELGLATLDQPTATISGPKSIVDRVKNLQVSLDVTRANDNISRSLPIQVVDENGLAVTGLSIVPDQVTLVQPVSQRGGYRNMVVKVVTTGQVGEGYRLTTVSVFPPTVTVFASNPSLVDKLPGYVETNPIEINARKDDIDVRMPLNLPEGISIVGDPTVNVVVGIAAIEGSVTLNDVQVEVINLDPKMEIKFSPERVNIILSGPLPILDRLQSNQLRVILDMNGKDSGIYQLVPKVDLKGLELRVESILPGSIEVTVGPAPTPSPTPPKK
jgi:YbbR domain-containing protein